MNKRMKALAILLLALIFNINVVNAATTTAATTGTTQTATTAAYIGDNFCHEQEIVTVVKILGIVLVIAKLFVPIVIIVMGIMDFYKVVISGDEAQMPKSAKSLGLRIVIGLFIFMAPTLINAVLKGLYTNDKITENANACQNCLLNPFGSGNCSTTAGDSGNSGEDFSINGITTTTARTNRADAQ